ncbi:MAG: sensor histidine kinase [Vulcanimicrobiaceae bacterium]
MLRSLRGRITFAYVAFVVISFVIVAVVLANEAVQFYVRNANDAVTTAASQIQQIVDTNPNASFQTLSSDVARLQKTGVRVMGFQHPPGDRDQRPPGPIHFARGSSTVFIGMAPHKPGGPPPPPDQRDSVNRLLFSISNLAGLHPARVDSRIATFFITADPNRLQTLLTSYAVLFITGLVLFAALGLLVGGYLARQALAPMIAVTGALRRFAEGDFSPQSVTTRDRTEVGDLAGAFNGAAAQVSAAFDERRRVEEYVRQFVADAGHELRTPLTVIRGYIDLLQRGALNDPAKRERAFETLQTETARMRTLIEKLIVLARLERPEPSTLNLIDAAQVARNVVDLLRKVSPQPSITLDVDDGAFVLAEEAELHEAIANLVDNARKYGNGSPIRVEVKRTDGIVVTRVTDSGPGIPAEDQPHVFDRFYRGSERGEIEGSGLGLAIAVQAINRAHGTLRLVESRPGNTVFEIKLPLASQREASPTELVIGKKPRGSTAEPAPRR